MSTPRSTVTGTPGMTITVTSPCRWQSHLSGQAATVRSPLWGVVTLVEQAAELSDEQLRSRLITLGGAGAMTVPAQHARKLSAQAHITEDAGGPGADVVGHGLLSRFRAGCRCGWCTSRAREGTCGCPLCMACQANTYFRWPR